MDLIFITVTNHNYIIAQLSYIVNSSLSLLRRHLHIYVKLCDIYYLQHKSLNSFKSHTIHYSNEIEKKGVFELIILRLESTFKVLHLAKERLVVFASKSQTWGSECGQADISFVNNIRRLSQLSLLFLSFDLKMPPELSWCVLVPGLYVIVWWTLLSGLRRARSMKFFAFKKGEGWGVLKSHGCLDPLYFLSNQKRLV